MLKRKNSMVLWRICWLVFFLCCIVQMYSGRPQYILIWPDLEFPFSEMSQGQDHFIKLQCPVTNCYITSNRTLFGDIRNFDVIVFMGKILKKNDLPSERADSQVYVFFNMESSPNYPIEDELFDGFFNRTATYRLDSDLPLPYMLIRDKYNNTVGPKINMDWVPVELVDRSMFDDKKPFRKRRAAAIFYSNCHSLSDREQEIINLQKELRGFGLKVDVYGACGTYECDKYAKHACRAKLTTDYFFYLSYENSMDVDYVTEKLLVPMQYNVVPVVFGGANYSRFLPPGSYLDATEVSTWALANKMADLITNNDKYMQYLWWKKHYTYHDPLLKDNICNFCAEINKWSPVKTYHNFRKWWNIHRFEY
ncbi:alpha-(1,3)-fucosyltransferase C-like [Plodia interpunctella]|uniref:alpha-(1,3)-fucosyltransferase C-like n=1 Tax=Plodia interpunctella TaxID=58824 RepID=UPI0023684AF2|nr:alpha-(1,3)-fucosyltransferase C-like [Plodia interpunctella]